MRQLQRLHRTARFGNFQGIGTGKTAVCQAIAVVKRCHRFVCQDRQRKALTQGYQPTRVPERNRLFDQVDTALLQQRHAFNRARQIPRLVHIHPHADAIAQCRLDRQRMTDIAMQFARADFQLKSVVPPFGKQAFSLVDVFVGVATRQGPEHRQTWG
ncbi:hypothetical protein D3C71_1257770 [compost metagenome]